MTALERRKKVQELLTEVLQDKVLYYEPERCVERLREARIIAREPEPLPSPLPEAVSYRMAHLLMRSATTKADYSQILKLVDEAETKQWVRGEMGFGPRPLILKLAVLARLSVLTTGNEAKRHRTSIQETYIEAVDRAKFHAYASDPNPRLEEAAFVQDLTHNLLEQSAYLLGLEVHRLESLPGWVDGLSFDNGWTMIAPQCPPGVYLPKHLAVAEIEAWSQVLNPQIVFSLGKSAETNVRCNGKPIKLNPNQVKLLVGTVLNRVLGGFDVRRIQNNKASFEQDLTILKNRLVQPLGIDRKEIFTGKPKDSSRCLSDKISFVGIIEQKTLTTLCHQRY